MVAKVHIDKSSSLFACGYFFQGVNRDIVTGVAVVGPCIALMLIVRD